jgi:hypothetical protein
MNLTGLNARALLVYLITAFGAFAGAPSLGAVAGLPESDPRVKTYRLLESEVMALPAAKRAFLLLRSSPCNTPRTDFDTSSSAKDPTRVLSAGATGEPDLKEYALSVRCKIDIDTGCHNGLVFFPIDSDGRWIWTAARIGYLNYFRAMSKRSGIPDSVIGSDLDAMEKVIISNINRRLRSKKTVSKFTGEPGQLGLDDDNSDTQNGKMYDLEIRMAHHWDTYLQTLPKKRLAALPSFEVDPGCGAGEIEFTVKMVPSNGKLSLISDFDWRLCSKQGVDPWGKDCDGWSPSLTGKKIYLSGKYRYIARWPTGATSRDTLDLTQYPEGGVIELTSDR